MLRTQFIKVLSCLTLATSALMAAEEKPVPPAAALANLPEHRGIARFFQHQLASELIFQIANEKDDQGKRIREELRIQKDQLAKIENQLVKAMQEAEKRNKNAEGDEPLRAMEEQDGAVLSLLSQSLAKEQSARFQELYCQRNGLMVLRHDTYAKRLDLPKAKKDQIVKLVDEYRAEAKPLHKAIFTAQSKDAAVPIQKKLNALAAELDHKILELLSDKERASWIQLVGKKFDWRDE